MDDQLEIIRDLNYISLITTSLNCFLGQGFWLLTAYSQIHNLNDNFHGILNLLITLNYQIFIFISYFGDSWLHYSLKSLVACIEDEYFLQVGNLDNKKNINNNCDRLNSNGSLRVDKQTELLKVTDNPTSCSSMQQTDHHITSQFKSRKKHVLFFKEFLQQFKNHLGTSWSNLSFKSNIHILRAFVTLIAAQILFDHEK